MTSAQDRANRLGRRRLAARRRRPEAAPADGGLESLEGRWLLAAVLPTITVVASDASAAETAPGVRADHGSFTISRTGDQSNPLTIHYTVGGTATAGTDYALTGSAVIPVHERSTVLIMTPIDDALPEAAETVALTLTADADHYQLGSSTSATITIADNEPTVSLIATDAASETPAGSRANPGSFTLARTGPLTSALTVTYTVTGTATPDDDYSALSGSVEFPIGRATVSVPVTVVDDALAENIETVALQLTAGAAYRLESGMSAGTVIIADNEPTIRVAAGDRAAAETGAGARANPGTFTITRSGVTAATPAITVHYDVSGTAANDGTDFPALSGDAVIPAGKASATITIAPIDDDIGEGPETVTITLHGDPGYTIIPVAAKQHATVTIADNEPAVALSATDRTATEAKADTARFTVTRTGPHTADLTVKYTAAGAAGQGSDFALWQGTTLLAGTITIPAGRTSTSVTLTALRDELDEGPEAATIALAPDAGTTYSIAANKSQATFTVNDAPALFSVAPGTWHHDAAAQRATFAATIYNDTAAPSGAFTVSVYASTDRLLGDAEDVALTTLSFPSLGVGKTLTVRRAVDVWQEQPDKLADGDYYLRVVFSSPGGLEWEWISGAPVIHVTA